MRLQRLTKTTWLATNDVGLTRAVRIDPKTLRWSIVAGFSEEDEKRALASAGHWWSVD